MAEDENEQVDFGVDHKVTFARPLDSTGLQIERQ